MLWVLPSPSYVSQVFPISHSKTRRQITKKHLFHIPHTRILYIYTVYYSMYIYISSRRGTQVVPLLRRGPRSAAQSAWVPGATSRPMEGHGGKGLWKLEKHRLLLDGKSKYTLKIPKVYMFFFMTALNLMGMNSMASDEIGTSSMRIGMRIDWTSPSLKGGGG